MRGTCIAIAVGVFPLANPAHTTQPEDPPAKARLVSESAALVPGRESWLGVTFEIRPRWHLYWNGLNATGAPPEIKLTLPEGYEAGETQWPAPRRNILPGGILDHVYENRVTLLIPVRVPADAAPGSTARFEADLSWMVCEDVCLLGRDSVSLSVPVAAPGQADPKPSADARLFEQARVRLPKPVPKENAPFRIDWKDGAAVITAPGAERIAFYPSLEAAGFEDFLRDGEAKSERLVLKLHPFTDGPVRLDGVLEIVPPKPSPPTIFALRALTVDGSGTGNPGGR